MQCLLDNSGYILYTVYDNTAFSCATHTLICATFHHLFFLKVALTLDILDDVYWILTAYLFDMASILVQTSALLCIYCDYTSQLKPSANHPYTCALIKCALHNWMWPMLLFLLQYIKYTVRELIVLIICFFHRFIFKQYMEWHSRPSIRFLFVFFIRSAFKFLLSLILLFTFPYH